MAIKPFTPARRRRELLLRDRVTSLLAVRNPIFEEKGSGDIPTIVIGGFVPDASETDGGLPNIDCTQNPPVFPSFDRSCLVAADCAIGTVQSDCCGTLTVTGINAIESQRFADAAAVCNSQFPDCDCRTQSTHADDGTREGAGRE